MVNPCWTFLFADEQQLRGRRVNSKMLNRLVIENAPRIFAVIQRDPEATEYQIVAWGMAFADGAEVVAVNDGPRMSVRSPEAALTVFALAGADVRLFWLDRVAETISRRS